MTDTAPAPEIDDTPVDDDTPGLDLAAIEAAARARLGLSTGEPDPDADEEPTAEVGPDADPSPASGEEDEPEVSPTGDDLSPDADTPDLADAPALDADAIPASEAPEDTAATPPETEPSEWDRAGAAFEAAWGVRPTYDEIEQTFTYARDAHQFINQLQSLPADHQTIIQSMLEGRFDPAQFAPAPAPARQPDDFYLDDTPAAQPPAPTGPDPVVSEIQALRQDLNAQQQAAWTKQVNEEVGRAQQEFMAETGLDVATVTRLSTEVNQRQTWTRALSQGTPAYDAYKAQLKAAAALNGIPVTEQPAPRPVADTPAPAPDPRTQAAQEQRATKAAAVGGTSTPSRPPAKRRSPLGGGGAGSNDGHAPQSKGDLQDAMLAQLQRLRGTT